MLKKNQFVLVKYRTVRAGKCGWYQMDIEDARKLWKNLRRTDTIYWFYVVLDYEVLYYNSTYGWSNGVYLLKYA